MVLLTLLSTPVLVTCLLAILCAVYLFYRFAYKPVQYFKDLGIPGPKPKPLTGNMALTEKYDGKICDLFKHLVSNYGPVSGLYFGTTPVYFISDLDLIKEITVKRFANFTNRNAQTSFVGRQSDGKVYQEMFTAKGDEWKKRRSILSPAFSAHKMKLMEPLIKESTVRLADKIQAVAGSGESVDVIKLYNLMTMEVILSTAFGRSVDVQGGHGGKLLEAVMTVFSAFVPDENKKQSYFAKLNFLTMAFPVLEPLLFRVMPYMEIGKALQFLQMSAKSIIEERMQSPNDETMRKDLLQLMIDANKGENKVLETGEIVADCIGFILAGYDTTGVSLTFITYLLALHPEVQERLAEEIHDYLTENPDASMYDASHELQYLDMVVKESLRLYSPAFGTLRYCNEACEINGLHFKKGCMIFIMSDVVHHNPEVYTDPDTFNPERFSQEESAKRHSCAYIPFGFGPRNCIGLRFALLETKMALIEIVKKFKFVLGPETKVPLEVVTANLLKPKSGVFLKFEPRAQ